MKILITNCVALNTGDAAIILSIIDLMRDQFGKNTEFIIYDPKPDITRRYYPELTWRNSLYSQITELTSIEFSKKSFLMNAWQRISKKWKISFNPSLFYFAAWCQNQGLDFITRILLNSEQLQDLYHYCSADLIISTGGTYLVETYSLAPRIFDYQITLLLKRPLVFYTQSLGPFLNQKNRKYLKNIFNQSILILLRDELSLKHLQDLNIENSKNHVSSDVVFSFQSQIEPRYIKPDAYLNKTKLKIAISVRFWQAFKTVSVEAGMLNFKSTLCAVTQYLAEQYNAEITYISTCQGIPEYWTDDSKLATEIYNLLPDNIKHNIHVNTDFHHPQILLEILKEYDLVIGTRMHMCILSLVAGTPVIPIAYEFKTKELFSRLGMSKWVHDIETINQENLINSIENFLFEFPKIKDYLFEQVEKEKYRAIKSGYLVNESLDKWHKEQTIS
ncbi:polysaccharide pyruvyl transferase family protein [Fortiea sp. LEGE XX443]|uniref:polysaccharide pyruvyl transferase family protein n=1 Tax=Fortiea sp. LEGE XX443 TaxID=1828611 RepID=UPI00188211D9|nr:polysaccharide pyruvyl transferase family protein [Fortiea sp. LEGE XX443]MBE9004342.1 polysaccharide pyruvyl transferase family protein [Fortiea sp. LEGE XX443]